MAGSGASASAGSTLWVQNHQYTSDGTHWRGIDPHFGCRLDCGAVGSISVADTMVSEIYSARAKIYVSSKNLIFSSNILSSAN